MRTKTMTADQMALEIMLSTGTKVERDRKLAALRKAVDMPTCPECGAVGSIEHGIGSERACSECGTNL